MTAITHLSGDRIVIGTYAVQRCMLCGIVLSEFNARDIAVASSDGSTTIPALSLGGFYEVEGNRTSLVGQADGPHFESDLDLPENCCIRNVAGVQSAGPENTGDSN